jgi:hypothetical protein
LLLLLLSVIVVELRVEDLDVVDIQVDVVENERPRLDDDVKPGSSLGQCAQEIGDNTEHPHPVRRP